jgi:hypothetical protein
MMMLLRQILPWYHDDTIHSLKDTIHDSIITNNNNPRYIVDHYYYEYYYDYYNRPAMYDDND